MADDDSCSSSSMASESEEQEPSSDDTLEDDDEEAGEEASPKPDARSKGTQHAPSAAAALPMHQKRSLVPRRPAFSGQAVSTSFRMPRPAGSPTDPAAAPVDDVEARRQANITALLNNSLETKRAPLMSRYLSLQQSDMVLKRAFVSPVPGAPALSEELRRKLQARRRHVPWGSSTPWAAPAQLLPAVLPAQTSTPPPPPVAPTTPAPPMEDELPPGVEPLVLWAPADVLNPGPDDCVAVDNMLVRWLRPHQRDGVAFMFECVTGLRLEAGRGCILADDMGLGKTLQAISLLWTMTQGGHAQLGGCPLACRSIIVCPTSLVGNWASEAKKWLKGRLSCLALCEASRDDVVQGIHDFLHPTNPYKVLILSYETFRIHAGSFQAPGSCDLLICDEAHRLKNDATLTNQALGSLPCRRRVLLSGTPIQNKLDEFYAMVDFCNPGVLGTPAEFRRKFEAPILASREPGVPAEVVARGEERSCELSTLVNVFILRRTNTLLSAHLPPKVVMIVCCKLTPLQQAIYSHFLESKAARKILGGKAASVVLPAISNLRKLCNHPKLIYDAVHSRVTEEERSIKGSKAASAVAGFEDVASLFPPCLFDDGRPGRGGMAQGWESTSGKFAVAARMLSVLWHETDDKIVLVSNFTQTLDLFAALCREKGYPLIRLDGSTSVSKREKLVQAFNDATQRNFIFLLSSKAGGCGLNLVGANRLLLYDVDWNPAVDKQAAGRVWRDGQQRRVYVYRFLSTGTIEEKVFQRQISKEGLQALVGSKGGGGGGGGGTGRNLMSAEELRELFSLHPKTLSHTYEMVLREAMSKQDDGEAAEAGRGKERGGGGASPTNGIESVDLTGEDDSPSRPDPRKDAGAVQPTVHATDAAAVVQEGTEHGCTVSKPQVGHPSTEEELVAWGHHSHADTVPDLVLQRTAGEDVSFVFSCQVRGKDVEERVFQPRAQPGVVHKGPAGRLSGVKRGAASSCSTPASSNTLPGQLSLHSRPAATGSMPGSGGNSNLHGAASGARATVSLGGMKRVRAHPSGSMSVASAASRLGPATGTAATAVGDMAPMVVARQPLRDSTLHNAGVMELHASEEQVEVPALGCKAQHLSKHDAGPQQHPAKRHAVHESVQQHACRKRTVVLIDEDDS